MKERGIIMSAPMVRAILDGRKTQTRRVLKVEDYASEAGHGLAMFGPRQFNYRGKWRTRRELLDAFNPKDADRCPYGVAGDRLWVRETFGLGSENNVNHPSDEQVFYRATDAGWDENETGFRWKPSIHMTRSASRITLEITKVRVERLQDISGADVVAEGVTYPVSPSEKQAGKCSVLWDISSEFSPLNYIAEKDRGDHEKVLIVHYAALWDSLHGKGAWEQNPWVWVLEFKKVKAAV